MLFFTETYLIFHHFLLILLLNKKKLLKAFFPSMSAKNYGHIVTVTNISSLFGIAGMCDYSASKFAVFAFEESFRRELMSMDKTGVHSTLVCHFYMKSKMNKLLGNE